MKIFLALFVCLFFGLNIWGQTDSTENNEELTVEEVTLARDDGSGKAGEATGNFLTTDVPIYCLIQLNATKAATIKMNVVAVKADGLRPETKIVTVSYKTNGKQNGITFHASPETIWAAGKYRIDILIDGKAAKSLEFEIKKSPKDSEKEKQSPPKSNSPVRPKPKSRKN